MGHELHVPYMQEPCTYIGRRPTKAQGSLSIVSIFYAAFFFLPCCAMVKIIGRKVILIKLVGLPLGT